jgi:hypothetical protein
VVARRQPQLPTPPLHHLPRPLLCRPSHVSRRSRLPTASGTQSACRSSTPNSSRAALTASASRSLKSEQPSQREQRGRWSTRNLQRFYKKNSSDPNDNFVFLQSTTSFASFFQGFYPWVGLLSSICTFAQGVVVAAGWWLPRARLSFPAAAMATTPPHSLSTPDTSSIGRIRPDLYRANQLQFLHTRPCNLTI